MKFKEKALFSSRELVAKIIKINMFLTTSYALDSSSIIDVKGYWEGFWERYVRYE